MTNDPPVSNPLRLADLWVESARDYGPDSRFFDHARFATRDANETGPAISPDAWP